MRKTLLLIALLGVLAYAGSFRCGWHLDDRHSITENVAIDDLRGALGGVFAKNRGLTDLTFTLNHLAGGNGPAGYHAVNLAIHLANAVLLFLIASSLAGGGERGRRTALFAFALFLLHPLATQSVTYIVQRYTSLAAFFYLGAVLLYLRGRRGSGRAAVLAWISALAASRCKEIALTLPLVLLWLETVFPVGERRARALRIVPFLAVAAIIPLTLIAGGVAGGTDLAGALRAGSRETITIDRGDYLITQIHVVTDYLRLLLVPIGQNLDPHVPVRSTLLEADTIAKALLLLLLAAGAVALRRKRPLLALGAGWFFLALLVESSLVPIRDVMFEHRTYLPSAGFFLGLASLAAALRRRAAFLLLVLLSLLLAGLTFARNRVWRDDVTLWTDCVRKSPEKPRAWANLGYALTDAGDREGAIRALRRSVDLEPRFPEDMVSLAELLLETGDRRGAEEMVRLALEVRPGYARARRNLAVLLLGRGEREAAFRETDRAVKDDPEYGAALRLRARLLLERGDPAGAARDARRAAAAEPAEGEGFLLLARARDALGESGPAREAVRRWREAERPGPADDLILLARDRIERGAREEGKRFLAWGAERYPADPFFPATLGALRLQEGDGAGAADALRDAVRRAPENPAHQVLLARALTAAGNRREAARRLETVLETHPDHAEARSLLDTLHR